MWFRPRMEGEKMRTMTRQQLGNWGENYAIDKLSPHGLIVTRAQAHCGDLRVMVERTGIVRTIEVKTARPDAEKKYQICLRKWGHTDCSDADYVLLLLNPISVFVYPFLIPSCELFSQRITISSHPTIYAGKYAKYRCLHFGKVVSRIVSETDCEGECF